jgi:hypothetical protein
MATIKELGDGGPDGTRLGTTSSELVGFWGKTPVNQPNGTNQFAVTTTALTTITDIVTTASMTGAINAVVARVDSLSLFAYQLRADLVEIGIIKGSN